MQDLPLVIRFELCGFAFIALGESIYWRQLEAGFWQLTHMCHQSFLQEKIGRDLGDRILIAIREWRLKWCFETGLANSLYDSYLYRTTGWTEVTHFFFHSVLEKRIGWTIGLFMLGIVNPLQALKHTFHRGIRITE